MSIIETVVNFFDGNWFKVALTITLILFSQIFRTICVKVIKKKYKKGKDNDNYRHTINVLKNIFNAIVLILIFVLWSSEIQQFAISIAAFTVAIVIATKEILQSFLGFIYINSSRIFKVGDWIQVGDNIGEVIDIDWSKITLLEIDKNKYGFTGKTTFYSNNLLLTTTIKNLNFMRRYVHHSFLITKEDVSINPFEVKKLLSLEIKEHFIGFENIAERYNNVIENKLGIKFINYEPYIEVSTSDIGKIQFHISFFCPTDRIQELEEKITEDFFLIWLEKENKIKK